jgi:DNA-binding NarL/FixJ family response regulator
VSASIRILLADDHPIFRRGLRMVIDETPGLTVIGEVSDGDDAIAQLERERPDIVILDLEMPRKDGLAVAGWIRDANLPIKAVLLTGHKSEPLVNKALDAGVSAYLLKESAAAEIVGCVRAVHAGKRYVSPELSNVLISRRARAEALVRDTPTLDDLTAAERRVLALVALGKTSKEIGEQLFISPRTVEHHRANISGKLGLQGANALVKFAVENRSSLTE